MSTSQNSTPVITFWTRISQSSRDLVIALIVIASVFLLSAKLDLSEKFIEWALAHESLQLDEFPLVLFAAAFVSIWFSRRRMREMISEANRRIKAEHASQESQRMFKTLFDQGLCGNFIADIKGNILLCNQSFSAMSGNSESTLNLKKAIGARWDELCSKLQSVEKVDIPELTVARPDNAPWIVMARLTRALDNPQSQEKKIHGFFTDITEQHLAERELAVLLKENQALARHAMQVQEEERRNIAREIHDEMGQYLTAIRLELASLPKDKQHPLTEFAVRINSHVEHIQQAVRGLIHRLRPTALDAHGIAEAIEQLVNEWKKQHPAVDCQLALDKSCLSLPEKISIVAYRIVQESLTNIARHAHANHISIKLIGTRGILSDTLTIEIRDDGVGFNPHTPRAGFGLSGMRERVEAEGGTFNVQSQGKGVVISANLPLSTEPKAIQES
ncbi:histidine kinase [Methylobacillus arboreus]|uniref:histidine kinase n=1 Tax=Methylobacillus arboreus TaxID=755170 RepID=UPI002E228267|nr:histidine kinase [Methylobacillus arboreus]